MIMNVEERLNDLAARTAAVAELIKASGEIKPGADILVRSLEQAVGQLHDVFEREKDEVNDANT